MLARTWALFRARLAQARRAGWALPALVFHALLATLLALLVRDVLPPYPQAFFALTSALLFLALPLSSDLGALLRRDEGGEWIAALPCTARERTLARCLHLCALLFALTLALLLPFAVLAPPGASVLARLALPLSGCGLALGLAALLIWVQQLLLARFVGLLVWLQTLSVVGVVVGLLTLLGRLPELARLEPGALRALPPSWFAGALAGGSALAPVLASAGALALLFLLPAAAESDATSARRGGRALDAWLRPLQRLAATRWVRPEERGAFELVSAALPREREFALRTLPLLGIPLAALGLGAFDRTPQQGDLLALLFCTVGVLLPVFLTHVPLSESARASWLLATAPVERGAVACGAAKALFVRYLVPGHLALGGVALALGEAGLVGRLWLPSLLGALLTLLLLYPRCVRGLPLSTAPEELEAGLDWVGQVAALAVGMTLAAVLANRFLTWPMGLAAAGVLLGAVRLAEGRLRAT